MRASAPVPPIPSTALVVLLLAAASLAPAALHAQAALRPVEHHPARALSALADSLRRAGEAAALLVPVAPGGAYHVVVVQRDRAGEPELHAAWDDVVLVQQGAGELRTGARLAGARQTEPGEERGGTVVGARVRRVAAGDLLVIPAGVAHQFAPTGRTSLRYVVVKGAAPAAPRRE